MEPILDAATVVVDGRVPDARTVIQILFAHLLLPAENQTSASMFLRQQFLPARHVPI
jgi:hypothetical protein